MVHSNIKTMEFPKFWEGKKKKLFLGLSHFKK